MFGHRDTGFKQSELSVDDVSGHSPGEDGLRIAPDRYVFRDISDSDRPPAQRYRDLGWGETHSVAVGGDAGRTFYGIRPDEQPPQEDAYLAAVELEQRGQDDRIASVGVRDEVYDDLDVRGREALRSAAVNAVEEFAGIKDIPAGAFEQLVLGEDDV